MKFFNFLYDVNYLLYLKAFVILIIGWIIAKIIRATVKSILKYNLKTQYYDVAEKLTYYVIMLATLMISLKFLGIDLKVILGAAGIFTVAFGFASQTSASNLISGFFLLAEKPFKVGDTIQVGQTTGVVLSTDLLSTRLRTFDNLMVRFPNETLMKSEITNLTYFTIKRIDIPLQLQYEQDLKHVENLLREISHKNVLCLEEPLPLFVFESLQPSYVKIKFTTWTTTSNFLKVKTEVFVEIIRQFKENNIQFASEKLQLSNIQE